MATTLKEEQPRAGVFDAFDCVGKALRGLTMEERRRVLTSVIVIYGDAGHLLQLVSPEE